MKRIASPRVLPPLLICVLALGACQRAPAPPADAAPATGDRGGQGAGATGPARTASDDAPATIPGADAVAAIDETGAPPGVQPPSTTIAGVDARSFAGVFVAEGARFDLHANGRYASSVHAASANADLTGQGTWTAQDGGRALLLDPDDESEPDLNLTVVSRDELRQGDRDGRVLHRQSP